VAGASLFALPVVLVVVARGELGRMVAAALSFAVTSAGVWYVLSRRSLLRLLGAVLAVVGLVALVIVVVTGPHRGLAVAVAIALVLLAAVSARYALSRDRSTLRAAPVAGTPVGAALHPVLLMNLKSGGGKAERFQLVDECRARGVQTVVLGPGDDLVDLAEAAVDAGADVIGMAGGDGSQALVADVASRRGVGYVCVPAGTRNHFALDLGLDRDDVVGALDAFAEAVERTIDLARVNGRVFVNNATMGLYAKIVQSQSYRDDKLGTAANELPDLLGPDAEAFDLHFNGPDGREHGSAHLILVSNGPYELQHLAGRGTRPSIDTGTLGIAALRISSTRDAVAFLGLEAAGRARRFPGLAEWSSPRFRVDSDAPVEIGIDGEALTMEPPLVFESSPGALRVRLPHHAFGVAPAASAPTLSSQTVRSLVAIARGRSPVEGDPPGASSPTDLRRAG
jgi:diacylglycerol kinase family enzyme